MDSCWVLSDLLHWYACKSARSSHGRAGYFTEAPQILPPHHWSSPAYRYRRKGFSASRHAFRAQPPPPKICKCPHLSYFDNAVAVSLYSLHPSLLVFVNTYEKITISSLATTTCRKLQRGLMATAFCPKKLLKKNKKTFEAKRSICLCE